MFVVLAVAAICLSPPVNGPVDAGYSPSGQYAGHWGVDYRTEVGDPVHAPVTGRVTFAGSVAGMNSVTVQPVSGFKVSISYLSEIWVHRGERVRRGEVIGLAGSAHDAGGVHMSTRVDGRYVDPGSQIGCRPTDISRALRLVTPPQPYPRTRANRNPGRNIRPDSRRASTRRRDCSRPTRLGPGGIHSRRVPMAEGRSADLGGRRSPGDDPSGNR